MYLRPHVRLTAECQCAAHHFAQASADDQAQPGTSQGQLPGVFNLGKRSEQAGLIGFVNANARVLDAELQFYLVRNLGWSHIHLQRDLSSFREFDGIADQVGQDLFEAQRVDQDIRGVVFGIE